MEPTLSELHSFVRVTAAVGLRDESLLEREVRSALGHGIAVSVLREVILQSYLFAGYAAAINALIVLNGIAGPDGYLMEEEPNLDIWRERGALLCEKVYGGQYEKLLQNMRRLHPDLADWMIWEGYGKVLSRPFLSPRVRELLIVGITAVLKVERQFYSHVRGALHVGASAEDLWSVFDQVVPLLEKSVARDFQSVLERVLSSRE